MKTPHYFVPDTKMTSQELMRIRHSFEVFIPFIFIFNKSLIRSQRFFSSVHTFADSASNNIGHFIKDNHYFRNTGFDTLHPLY